MTIDNPPAVPTDLIDELLDIYPEEMRAFVAQGLKDLRLPAGRLAFEILDAEQKTLPFAEAAGLPGFHFMSQLHYGVIDVLQYEISPHEEELLRETFRRMTPRLRTLERAERVLFEIAASTEQSPWPALARFVLYQTMRLGLWLKTWPLIGAEALEATGVLQDMDFTTEERMRSRLEMQAMREQAVRPLSVLFAELFETLDKSFEAAKAEIQSAGKPLMEYFMGIMEATKTARALDAADAALVRHAIDVDLEREGLHLRAVAERHSFVLPSVDAAKKRRSRMLAKLAAGEPLAANRPRVIDLLSELVVEMEKNA